MDRREFIGGIAGNLLALPLGAIAKPTSNAANAKDQTPQSGLSALAANTARNLGGYASSEIGGRSITDYSSIVYDPVGRRMCLFGGGHGASQETDIRVFDLTTLQWSSLYAPTPRSAMNAGNGDSDLGRWISTNQPYARHSYNMALIVGPRYYLMTPEGMPDHLDAPGPAWGGRVCWFDFAARTWQYSQIAGNATPWYYAAAAAFDPVSQQIIVAGPNNQAGTPYLWLYDPAKDSLVTGPPLPNVGHSHDLVYFPPNDRFYILQSDGRVWEITLDRSNFNASSAVPMSVTGTGPIASSTCGFAYDDTHRIIGGNVAQGVFYAFDPPTAKWTAVSMQTETGSSGIPNEAFNCLDFDSVSGCFVFLSDSTSNATWAYRYGGAESAPAVVGVADLAITLDFGAGRIATFSGANAVELGDFVGDFVRQKNYVATHSDFPDWRVFFRVDADEAGARIQSPAEGWRDEVVVEYGRSTLGAPVHVTEPYTATITKAGSEVASHVVPNHWWYARWRYQSSERTVVRSPAALKAKGWIANFGPQGLFGLPPNMNAVTWDGPMSAPRDKVLGAFANVMGAAGDNPQIGFLTEYAADYVINDSPESLTSLRTEGEWCGNWCIHIRDDSTGGVPDVRGNRLRYRGDGGTISSPPNVDAGANAAFVSVDAAHFYPCANLPWMLTDDPYLLEELQFCCNWQILFDAYHRTVQGLEGLVYPGQTRSFAWGLRDLFTVAASTPVDVPAWLQPRAYWQSCIDDNKAFALRYVNSPARIHALFRTWTRTDLNAAWMSAWLNAVVGIAVEQGFTDWRDVFDWGIDFHIQQTNGTSGWSRQWPVPYYFIPNKVGYGTPSLYFSDTSSDASTCASWADAWSYYCSGSDGHTDTNGHTIDPAGWDGHTLMQQFYQTGPSYFLHLRAALAMAVRQRVPGARACYDYIQGELRSTTMPHYGRPGQARFSIDPDSDHAGMWWNAPAGSESGWGISLAQQADVIFAIWFTYNAAGAPWWLAMTAERTAGNAYEGAIYRTSGPPYDAATFDPNTVSVSVVGIGKLVFGDSANGTFEYTVDGKSQVKPITRFVFGNPVPVCTFGAPPDAASATNFQDIWWNSPPGSESGWGLSVTHQGDTIFAVWLTYDANRESMWLASTARKTGPGTYAGPLYRYTGPSFDATPFDPSSVVATSVGSATLAFQDGNSAQFSYTIGAVSRSKTITREIFEFPGTTCI